MSIRCKKCEAYLESDGTRAAWCHPCAIDRSGQPPRVRDVLRAVERLLSSRGKTRREETEAWQELERAYGGVL